MSREQKISKLCRAVRAYRGASHGKREDGRVIWNIPPQRSQQLRVLNCINKLGIDAHEAMEKINNFQTFEDFNKWVETLRPIDENIL